MKLLSTIQTITVGIALFTLYGCEQETPDVCDVYYMDPINISIDQLLTLPHCFDKKHMMTKGIIDIQGSGVFVYPSRLDYDLGNTYHALLISLNNTVDQDTLSATIKDGSYVLLYGEFESPRSLKVSESPSEIK